MEIIIGLSIIVYLIMGYGLFTATNQSEPGDSPGVFICIILWPLILFGAGIIGIFDRLT